MDYVALKSHRTGQTLFAGFFNGIKDCLEEAIRQETDLSHVDLSQKNLATANLDGAHMPHAELSGANLAGANLSEANLANASFRNADLYNTCLCYSDLRTCDFVNCNFGGTDIAGADIRFSKFSNLSCFDLDFFHTEAMQGCIYMHAPSQPCEMSYRPIVLKGLFSTPIIILDTMIKIGGQIFSKDIFPLLVQTLEHQSLLSITETAGSIEEV